MTLEDVAEATGMTLEFLMRELGLPDDIEADDRLGRVARDNDLSVAEVREIVERGMERTDESLTVSVGETPPPLSAPSIAEQPPAVTEEPPSESHVADLGGRAEHEGHAAHEDEMAGMADIRGAMTLAEIVALGVPRDVLYRELKIPTGTPIDERLGRLGRTYGFSMTQVRDLVEAHR
jgi:hypothetical protein